MSVEVSLNYIPVVNFSMQQNHVRIIREIAVKNTGGTGIENLEIAVSFDPEFAEEITLHVDSLPADGAVQLADVPVHIITSYLAELTERIEGLIKIEVRSAGKTLVKQAYDIALLAFDQWSGVSVLPAMLAAFVTPNHPEIVPVIRRASEILAKWTGSPSFDEYQTRDPNRVKQQMAAIYEAIAELQIAYCAVPASFEERGQRVRMATDILGGRLGTCLDMTLLYASCLEAVGINALLVLVHGHAMVAAWLIPETFPDSVNDDVSLLTKRTAEGINEILPVETTCMNAGAIVPFDAAVATANARLKDTDSFQLFIDVHRARNGQIRPLPLRVARADGGYDIEEPVPPERNADAPAAMGETHTVEDVEHISVSKQTIWERKLLDLSLRNSLLNTRITNNTLQLISANVSDLEDALAAGVEFQILPKPDDWDNPLMSAGIYQALNASDPIIDLVRSELQQKHLYSYLSEESLRRALTHLYRSSRLSLEENGANTLYLAVGLLKWFETPTSTRPRFAPILLLPIEIVKKSAAKGFLIRSRDEDTALNITLLEMLRQDFGISIGGLETLPTDDNGVDVARVFNVIRRAIMSESRWDVEEQAILGNFSFNKFIMWNDIHNNADKLARNRIVAALISGRPDWSGDPGDESEETDLDKAYPPESVALPIGADSSQFEAICAAVDNKSFILHGPPGTGKSQTITNIIANALYNGKKVLFVAEKMAALQVVQHRLDDIGLAPFCLELHSNKTKKSYILEQLKSTTEIVKRKSADEFRLMGKQIKYLRKELNDYVQALHRVYPSGLSLYDCFTRYAAVNYDGPTVRLSAKLISGATPDTVATAAETVADYRGAAAMCGSPARHPLAGIGLSEYSATLRDEAEEALKSFYTALGEYRKALDAISRTLSFKPDELTAKRKNALDGILRILLDSPELPAGLLSSYEAAQQFDLVDKTIERGRERDAARDALLRNFSDRILRWDFGPWADRWHQSATKWWLPRLLERMKVKKQLRAFGRRVLRLSTDEVTATFGRLEVYERCQQEIVGSSRKLEFALGRLWDADHADWDAISRAVAAVRELCSLLLPFGGGVTAASHVKRTIYMDLSGSPGHFEYAAPNLREALEAGARVDEASARLQQVLATGPFDKLTLSELHDRVGRWSDNIGRLRQIVTYNQQRERMVQAGLKPIVDATEARDIKVKQIEDCYAASFYRAYAEYILSQEKDLNAFHGMLFEEKIERFRQYSTEYERLTREELYARLASNLPALQKEAVQSSEVGILQRNIRNGGRGTSIRRLFEQIPDLLTRMCPCMLMSPISVAQYIDADRVPFDLVIFDEASQMPTSEAVGAIARGKNVIVVGDPKQMPPTSFFATNTFDEDNADKEDLENILEDCLALTMPSKYLRWHYRSRHESLIAFSNMKYYDNRLYTFPSPDDLTTKVGWQYVEGVYDRGRSRQNRAEAEAVVAEIERRLSDKTGPRRSIGVVTFNTNQQSLIEDLLTDLFASNPQLEAAAAETYEPIFIKNLENVQGDERDVILFSIGYGPDKDGRIALNFGPLNRDGGGRRLNVAVSRARYEMKVFSTLKAEQIDLNRTSAEGVADLKAFLEYAEKGRDFMGLTSGVNSGAGADALVESIAAELRARGHQVRTNIGSSGYKIDIGVVDPGAPDKYLLGILLDGHNYAASRTASDRVVTQHSVLRQLGWHLHRVWSMDWWENRDATLEAIEKAIGKARTAPAVKTDNANRAKLKAMADMLEMQYGFVDETDEPEDPYVLPYQQCLQKSVHLSSDEFASGNYDTRILKRMADIVAAEAPISKNLLARRVIVSYGITRMGPRMATHFDELLQQTRFVQSGTDAPFYWRPRENPDEYAHYRPESNREAMDIAPEEMAVAIVRILKDQVSLPLDALKREVAQTFHFARLSDNVAAAVNRSVDYALDRGRIVIENDRVKLP